MEQLWNGCGTAVWWNGGETAAERLWNGCGTVVERLWNGCGTAVERLWNGCGTVVERLWNGCVGLASDRKRCSPKCQPYIRLWRSTGRFVRRSAQSFGRSIQYPQAGAYTRSLLSSTSAVLVTPPVSPCLIDWGKIMHPTYPTRRAYVEPKSGRV